MKSLKGSQTEKNLLAAFAGESQARNRYTFAASKAKREGYEQISALFLETAENEKEHAKRYFSYLEGGEVEITAGYPAGFPGEVVGNTLENLKAAAAGENAEHTSIYPGFADVIQGPWLMEQMKAQAENVGTEMIMDHISKVDLKTRPFRLEGESGDVYTCDALIISTGAQARWLGIPSEEKLKGYGVQVVCRTGRRIK